MNTDNAIAVILAAGNGHRIGTAKWKLRFSAQQSFLERLAEMYSMPVITQTVVVVNQRDSQEVARHILPPNALIIINDEPEHGRNHSLRLGLKSLEKFGYAFVQNIDNPFTSAELIMQLWKSRLPDGAVIPTCNQKAGHPVLLGNQLCLDLLHQPTASFHFRIWLLSQKYRLVETNDPSILANINTQEDLAKAHPFFPKPAQ